LIATGLITMLIGQYYILLPSSSSVNRALIPFPCLINESICSNPIQACTDISLRNTS
jgi:hypothetical protein